MSETLSLAFAFAWLFGVPPVPSQDTAPDALMKSLSGDQTAEIRRRHAIRPAMPPGIGVLEKKDRQI